MIKIRSYREQDAKAFCELNLAWIEEMFEPEPADLALFENLNQVVEKGSKIFVGTDEDDTVICCVMMTPLETGEWELEKFASRKDVRSRGAGRKLLDYVLNWARKKGIERIILVSNTKCEAALHLYRQNGFYEIPVDRKRFPFERGNISMTLDLNRDESEMIG